MAGTVYTSDYLAEYYNGAAWTAFADNVVISAEGSASQALSDNGAGFGDEAITDLTLVLRLAPFIALDFARLPIRVTFTINAGSQVAFVGEVAEADGDLDTVTLHGESMLASLPGRTRDYYSPLRRRRAPATKTTASSVEDPDNGAYVGGLINELFWRAGGRPNEQSGTYPSAAFYYSCEQAIRAPDWSWVAGENGYEEIKRLAQAVGGQIAQGMDGVIRYKQPLTMVGSVAQTFTIADFRELTWRAVSRDQYAKTFTMSYTPRRALPVQEVVNDTTYRTVAAGETLTIDLEPRYPVVASSWVLDAGTLKEKNLTITFFDGALAAYHATTGFTTTTTVKAMRLTIAVTNHTSRHMQISKIVVSGSPVAPGEVETVTVGSGDPARIMEENAFVQTKAHALALVTMALSFYGVARAVRTLTELVYSTARTIGETVALTVSELSLSAAPHIILTKRHTETGRVMELELVDAAGLPALADYWLVASGAQSGTHKIAW